MSAHALRRAQLFRLLADAFIYPQDPWTADLPLLEPILRGLGLEKLELPPPHLAALDLETLQAAHRRTFGLSGSLCHETECGLPDAFRQSQELADIAGFYRAFGVAAGGPIRDRPDHVAVELEFLHLLALKEAWAELRGRADQVQVCVEAERAFLRDHLGRWIELFAHALQTLEPEAPENPAAGLFAAMARLTGAVVRAEAFRLGVRLTPFPVGATAPTPYDPDPSCAGCPVAA